MCGLSLLLYSVWVKSVWGLSLLLYSVWVKSVTIQCVGKSVTIQCVG